MRIIETELPDVFILEPRVFGDQRGYFCETFRLDSLEEKVGKINFVQDNESMSKMGVLRGLHFQKPPYTQSKLVRVIQGEVIDVVVDIRVGSPTYGKHVSAKLSGNNKRQLWSPKGFAHGYCVLSKEAIFAYKVDAYYYPESEGGILWNDEELNIDWQIELDQVLLSEKDQQLERFRDVKVFSFKDFKQSAVYPKG